MSNHNNIVRIKAIAGLMDQLHEDVVFVGGATVSLYADLKATESRPTDDVDIIIELASYHKYVVLDERLRDAGFVNDTASGVSLTKKGGVTSHSPRYIAPLVNVSFTSTECR